MPTLQKHFDTTGQSLVIAICTYCRPTLLKNLLANLEAIAVTQLADTTISILVVDNDSNMSAKTTTANAAATSKYNVTYLAQPIKGLSTVRNTALEFAKNDDFLVFVDDDEQVENQWLEELLANARIHNAAFVIGPVRPTFPPGTPKYFIDSGLYFREEYKNGKTINGGNSGNALIDIKFIEKYAIRFREDFNKSGGEDTFFFAEVVGHGGKGVFAANAIAYEPVAADRLSIYWLIIRRCRFGATQVLSLLIAHKRINLVAFKFISLGILRILATPLLVLLTLPFRPGLALRYLCGGARGFGFILGAIGRNVDEY